VNVAAAAEPSTTTAQIAARCRIEPIVFDGVRPDLCPALAEVILCRMRTDRQRTASLNVGGWKSTEDFFAWPDAPVQELRQWIVAELGAARPIGWAMVNRAGSHHPRHQHLNATLVGVYYVTAGSEDAITPTIFECPSGSSTSARGRDLARGATYELEVEPQPGRLVICRGEAWHRVPKYLGELPRITIAFDIRR
jgi:Putative 2OG-Fe(II) oxygenase